MKRLLFSLVTLVVTSLCFAQDIIVQKDGSTIQAKVLKVSQSEVEYKKFSNLEGPTYTISTKELQCINYENGTKDTFVSPNYNPNIKTNETATQFSNDQQLLNIYIESSDVSKKAKKLKQIAWIGTPFVMFGMAVLVSQIKDGCWILDNAHGLAIPVSVGFASGLAWWAGFYFSAKHMEKQSLYSVQSSPIYQQEFYIGKNDRLMVGIDVLKDNTRKNQTLGLGLSYKF